MVQVNNHLAQSGSDDRCPVAEPKFGFVINDSGYSSPRREISVATLKSQAGITNSDVLIRDHNSPNDVALHDEQTVDLVDGNVFYTISKCDFRPRGDCGDRAKLAFFVDDAFEVTTNPSQTEITLKGLFALPEQTRLVRDLKSPNDVVIGYAVATPFEEGPVFITREPEASLRITVNHRRFTEDDGVKERMTGLAIAALVYPENPKCTKVQLGDRVIGHDEEFAIEGCESFEVIRSNVKGGFELTRVQREIELLRESGASVTIVESPIPSIIYHGLKTRLGCEPARTDVLVPIPSGYPNEIDWAYLPLNSPLIGRVEGSPQDHRIEALGTTWRQISYHPHRGGGGPAFNPTKHGFHTYISEVLSWLHQVK